MNILITGGSAGLGEAIVHRLAKEEGFTIYFTYAKSGEAARSLESLYANAHAIQCDFRDTVSVETLAESLERLNIDVLINNANSSINKNHFHKTATSIFKTSFEHNVMPVLQITSQAIKTFRKKKSGKIINILSSYIVNKPPTGLSEYVANKEYLHAMSKAWAAENIKFNISSNCISPSFMLTNFTADTDERILEQMEQEHPLKQLLKPVEVAESVLFLIRSSQQVNGANIIINAGADMI